MFYSPANGSPKPYPSHAAQFREYHGDAAWLYNPWTGKKRDPRDIGNDTFGLLIHDNSSAATQAAHKAPGLIEYNGVLMPVVFCDVVMHEKDISSTT